jgi:transcriptional regulator with XRE-family HTH domain
MEEVEFAFLSSQFRAEVEKILRAKRITRSQLADRMKVRKPFVTEILRSDSTLTLKTVCRIAEALGYNVAIVLAPKGKKKLEE